MSREEKEFTGVDFSKYVVLWCEDCECFHSEATGCVAEPAPPEKEKTDE